MINGFKKIVLSLSVAAMATALPAQAKGGMGGFGIKGGIGLGKLDTTGAENAMGFGGGLTLSGGAGPVGFMVDFLYMIRKSKLKSTAAATDLTLTANQIYVPIQAVFHLGPMFSLTGGGYLGYGIGNVSQKGTYLGTAIDTSSSYSDAGMKNLDYGVVAGLGIMMSRLSLEARYNLGLADLNDGGGSSLKYKGFDVLVGFMF